MRDTRNDGLTQVLARHVAGTQFEDLPVTARAAASESIFDTLGVMLAGSASELPPSRMLPFLAGWEQSPSCSVIGHTAKLSAPHAALANGAMAHQFDLDDTHDAALVHPTGTVLAAALAVAESIPNCSGSELLKAVVLGNDVCCRLGLALTGRYMDYSFLRGPAMAIWGATAAVAALLKLSEEQTAWAFGLTLHQTSVTMECLSSGSDVRGLRDGFAARAGLTAAYMAQAGISGDAAALEGRHGLFAAFFRGDYRPERVVDELGVTYEGTEVSLKPWPSSREGHAAIRALLELHEKHGFQPDDVREIVVHVGPTEATYCEPLEQKRRPRNRSDALQSLPYALAVAAVHGSVPLGAYTGSGLDDVTVLEMVKRVRHVNDRTRTADWRHEVSRVEVVTTSGTLEGIGVPGLGSPLDPLSRRLQRRKFIDCAATAGRRAREADVDQLYALVTSLEAASVADLSNALQFSSVSDAAFATAGD